MFVQHRFKVLALSMVAAVASGGCKKQQAAAPTTSASTTMASSDDATALLNLTYTLKGKPAPEIKVTTLDGKPFALSDLKGKVVVLDFWATWCVPCVQAMPHLQEMSQRKALVDAGLVVLAVNLQEEPDRVRKFLDDKKLTFPVVIDDDKTKIAEAYRVEPVPVTVVIGRDGNIAEAVLGALPTDLEKIEQATAKALAAK
ncbi:MAG: thiol-disulfide isomerase-like thioredoxin [Phycisphaerales bacterium]|nr:thiol-disulfide isomerase-like thioredoxin [Phycisphaerales bacterium]